MISFSTFTEVNFYSATRLRRSKKGKDYICCSPFKGAIIKEQKSLKCANNWGALSLLSLLTATVHFHIVTFISEYV